MKIQKIKLRCSQVMLGNNCETMGNNYAKQTKTKEMLLLEFEFVTLSGYKTDLVAVLNLFVCPEDFMWISSALQGKMLEKPGELILQRKSVCFF